MRVTIANISKIPKTEFHAAILALRRQCNEDFQPETPDTLWRRFQAQVTQLTEDVHLGLKEILAQSLLTPACGTGYMSQDDARRVLTTLKELGSRGQEWLASL